MEFSPLLREMIQFDEHIVQMGLVQPPTRKVLLIVEKNNGGSFFSFCFDRDMPNAIRVQLA